LGELRRGVEVSRSEKPLVSSGARLAQMSQANQFSHLKNGAVGPLRELFVVVKSFDLAGLGRGVLWGAQGALWSW
jgi:hypothetical protein